MPKDRREKLDELIAARDANGDPIFERVVVRDQADPTWFVYRVEPVDPRDGPGVAVGTWPETAETAEYDRAEAIIAEHFPEEGEPGGS